MSLFLWIIILFIINNIIYIISIILSISSFDTALGIGKWLCLKMLSYKNIQLVPSVTENCKKALYRIGYTFPGRFLLQFFIIQIVVYITAFAHNGIFLVFV